MNLRQPLLTSVMVASQLTLLLVVFFGLGQFFYPVIFSIILLYLSQPAIDFFSRRLGAPLPLTLGVIFVLQMLVIIAILVIAIPFLIQEASSLVKQFPIFVEYFLKRASDLALAYEIDVTFDTQSIQHNIMSMLKSIGQISPSTLYKTYLLAQGTAGQLLSPIYWIINLLLIPIIYFFIGLNAHKFEPWLTHYTPKIYRYSLLTCLRHTNQIFSIYYRGQIVVVSILSILYATSLYLIGIPYGFITGIITGVLSFVPYLGIITGFTIASLSLFYITSKLLVFSLLVCSFLVINLIESFYLTPTFMGNKVGLSNFSNFLCLIIGANLFGILGLLFAIPVTASLVFVFKMFSKTCHDADII